MAAESPGPRHSRRRWVVPTLLLGAGAGAWVVVRRRSSAEPVDVWAPRPPVERMIVPPTLAPPAPTTPAPVSPAPVQSTPATELPAAAPVARPLVAASSPVVGTTATATGPSTTPYGPGSAVPLPDGGAPGPGYTIKGNGSSRLFHPPSSPYYGRTRAEVWFRTADDAVAAGFSPYRSRRR